MRRGTHIRKTLETKESHSTVGHDVSFNASDVFRFNLCLRLRLNPHNRDREPQRCTVAPNIHHGFNADSEKVVSNTGV